MFVNLPKLDIASINPTLTFRVLELFFPCAPNVPLLRLSSGAILTTAHVSTMFEKLQQFLGLTTVHFTSHTLRRSGATCASNAGATPLQITNQGLWTSEAYMNHLLSSPELVPAVEKAFQSALQL